MIAFHHWSVRVGFYQKSTFLIYSKHHWVLVFCMPANVVSAPADFRHLHFAIIPGILIHNERSGIAIQSSMTNFV